MFNVCERWNDIKKLKTKTNKQFCCGGDCWRLTSDWKFPSGRKWVKLLILISFETGNLSRARGTFSIACVPGKEISRRFSYHRKFERGKLNLKQKMPRSALTHIYGSRKKLSRELIITWRTFHPTPPPSPFHLTQMLSTPKKDFSIQIHHDENWKINFSKINENFAIKHTHTEAQNINHLST